MAKVFISYRRDDSAGHTGRLFDSLEERFGNEAFFRDVEDLEPGVDFPAALDRALSVCDAMLVMIGPAWAAASSDRGRRLDQAGDFVRVEVAAARARASPYDSGPGGRGDNARIRRAARRTPAFAAP